MTITFPVKIRTLQIHDGAGKRIFYPQVYGMRNPNFQSVINRAITQQTQELIEAQAGNMPETIVEMLGFYEVKNNQRDVLSLSLSNYAYHDKAAHGMTYIKSLTFDLSHQKLVALKDLFKPGSNYIEKLSSIIQKQIFDRGIPLLDTFTTIQPNQDFYIADKTLVIYFQLYELTPYAYGFPMFPISVYDIQDMIKEDGALGRMTMNN